MTVTMKRKTGRRLAPVTLLATAPRELHPALSQPRAVLILLREWFLDMKKQIPSNMADRLDPQITLAESGIETLNELIGDKPKLRRG